MNLYSGDGWRLREGTCTVIWYSWCPATFTSLPLPWKSSSKNEVDGRCLGSWKGRAGGQGTAPAEAASRAACQRPSNPEEERKLSWGWSRAPSPPGPLVWTPWALGGLGAVQVLGFVWGSKAQGCTLWAPLSLLYRWEDGGPKGSSNFSKPQGESAAEPMERTRRPFHCTTWPAGHGVTSPAPASV